jgi:hypothetical protein
MVKDAKEDPLTEVLKNAKTELYSSSNLPPTPSVRKYEWVVSPDQPPAPPGEYNKRADDVLVTDDCDKYGCVDLI